MYYMKCDVSDCQKDALKKGFCNAHYLRYWRHGSPTAGALKKGEARDYVLVAAKHDGTECLIWPYARDVGGSGVFNRRGKLIRAPREICRIVHGEPPSAHHQAAHSCGNGHKGCVNPAHLRWATPTENNQDKIEHGTSLRGEANPRSKITEADVLEMRRMHKVDFVPFAVIARQYGLSGSTVSDAVSGRNWSWLK